MSSLLTISPVWLLRSRKLQQLELLGPDEKQQTNTNQAAGGDKERPIEPRHSGLREYVRGMTAIRKV